MADLTAFERRKLEKLFGMGGGYVLITVWKLMQLSTEQVATPRPSGCARSGMLLPTIRLAV